MTTFKTLRQTACLVHDICLYFTKLTRNDNSSTKQLDLALCTIGGYLLLWVLR